MKFDKYVAAGNDFLAFNGIEYPYDNYSELALNVCNRHFGIGADGILVCEKSDIADIKMLYYNSDGSQGEMCGNGIRSFAKYIYDNSIVKKKNISIETLDGVKYIEIEADELGFVDRIKVDMGYPTFKGNKIPIKIDKEYILEEAINIDGKDYKFSAVLVGVPHVVIFVEDIGKINVDSIGSKIENHPIFPKKANVNFVKILDFKSINIYTWERGAGRTLGCGTGSCASVVIGNLLQKLGDKIDVKTEGGSLQVQLDNDNRIFMIGSASHIARGEYLMGDNKR